MLQKPVIDARDVKRWKRLLYISIAHDRLVLPFFQNSAPTERPLNFNFNPKLRQHGVHHLPPGLHRRSGSSHWRLHRRVRCHTPLATIKLVPLTCSTQLRHPSPAQARHGGEGSRDHGREQGFVHDEGRHWQSASFRPKGNLSRDLAELRWVLMSLVGCPGAAEGARQCSWWRSAKPGWEVCTSMILSMLLRYARLTFSLQAGNTGDDLTKDFTGR